MSFCLLCVCLYATLTILICQYLKLLVTFNIATCDFTTISYFTLTACTPFDIIVIALVLRRDKICGCSSSGRAPPCQGGGSEFEPRQPLQKKAPVFDRCFLLDSWGFLLLLDGEAAQKRTRPLGRGSLALAALRCFHFFLLATSTFILIEVRGPRKSLLLWGAIAGSSLVSRSK